MEKYGVHWFRRDLRIFGNPALDYQIERFSGRVLGFFCFDAKFLARDDFSVNRFQFFLETLARLREQLRLKGGDLLVLDTGPAEAFSQLLGFLSQHDVPRPELISWNRDYEPFAVARDSQMREFFRTEDIEQRDFRDHLIIEPHELTKDNGEGYQVYSPFARKWLKIMQGEKFSQRLAEAAASLDKNYQDVLALALQWSDLASGSERLPDHLDRYRHENIKRVTVDIPEPGFAAAISGLARFAERIDRYDKSRDIPSLAGTSRMSHFLKNGTITTAQIISHLNLKSYDKKSSARDTYYSELIWREFYFHILARHPRVEKEAFLEKYQDLDWEDRDDWFDAWRDGVTGYPIVDAGMRELLATGHMHNRVRMIVSSFLTKDLLINWQRGEEHFMKHLLDGDLAANNGGWQWAASTGCDPQPYFRIFNPWLQSKKFDPDGQYIKRFVPELEDLPSKQLHAPILDHHSYPKPIVDHKERREKALKVYKKLR